MKYTYYLKHDSNAHADPKIKALRLKYGWGGYGWYWYFIETMRNENDYAINISSESIVEGLAEDMRCEPAKAQLFIEACINLKLFRKKGDFIYSERLHRDMEKLDTVREKRSKAGKESARKRWGDGVPEDDRLPNPEEDRIITFYEENHSTGLTPMDYENLKDMMETFGSDRVLQVMQVYPDKNLRYIEKVLAGEKDSGTHKGHTTTAEELKSKLHKPLH